MTSEELEPLLSDEENRAILDAMRETSASRVEPLRIGAPDGPLKAVLAATDRASRAFVGATRKLFVRHLSVILRITETPAEVRSFAPVRRAIGPGSCVAVLRAHGGELAGLLVLGPWLTGFALERRLGVPEQSIEIEAPAATLSKMDRKLLFPLVASIVDEVARHLLGPKVGLAVGDLLATPADLEARDGDAPLLTFGARIERADGKGDDLLVALTTSVTRSIVVESADEPTSHAAEAARRAELSSLVPGIEVEARAILGTSRTTVGAVLSLNVGDVVRLDTIPGRPLALSVGERTVLFGVPIVHHGNLGLEIVDGDSAQGEAT